MAKGLRTPGTPGGPPFRMGIPVPRVVDHPNGPDAREFTNSRGLVRGKPATVPITIKHPYFDRMGRVQRTSEMPVLPKVGLVTSVAGQQAALTAGLALLEDLKTLAGTDLGAAESGHLEKALVQSGFVGGWQFIEGGMRTYDAPDDLEEASIAVAQHIEERGRRPVIAKGLGYSRGKQKGLPLLTKSDDALLPGVLGGRLIEKVSDIPRVMRDFNTLLGTLGLLPDEPWGIMGSRTGPIGKQQPWFSELSPNLPMVWTHDVVGTACRRRHIHMYSLLLNAANRPNTTAFKMLLRSLVQFEEVVPSEVAAELESWRARGFVILDGDYSGLDKSVTTPVYANAIDNVWRRFAVEPERMDLYKYSALDIPCIAPGWSEAEPLILYNKDGGVASGWGGTTVDDCVVSMMAIAACVADALGVDVATALDQHGRNWRAWHWGDDTMLALPRGVDHDRFVARAAMAGLKLKLGQAPVFLMVAYPAGGAPTNLVSRTFMQSIWREKVTRFESVVLFGLWVRTSLALNHPMFLRCWRAIVEAAEPDGVLTRNGVARWSQLDMLVRSPAFQRRLREDLASSEDEAVSFLEGISRGGDYSSPAAQLALKIIGADVSPQWFSPIGDTGIPTRAEFVRAVDVYMRRVEKRAADVAAKGSVIAGREDDVEDDDGAV